MKRTANQQEVLGSAFKYGCQQTMPIQSAAKFSIPFVIFSFLAIILTESISAETRFKIRAREHFDTVWIEFKDSDQTYSYEGIGPNINLWLEDPYRFSIGLSYSVLFINNDREEERPEFNSNMDLTKYGIESKIYFSPGEGGLFTRIGISSNVLNTNGAAGNIKGTGGYLGLGYEIKFSKVGLAFEAAGRRIELEQNIRIDTYSPSIGVHFYGYI